MNRKKRKSKQITKCKTRGQVQQRICPFILPTKSKEQIHNSEELCLGKTNVWIVYLVTSICISARVDVKYT